jgi:pyrimidine operon attenuation protein/uracil phosphoribosyltransferase
MRVLADQRQVHELIDQLAEATRRDMASVPEAQGWALVGIRSRGDVLAQRLAPKLDASAVQDRVGSLDITLYRDDLTEIGATAVVRTTDIPFNIDGLNVVLIDDVLMTGRSIRAALQSLLDLGRPQRVWLSVLVDRGGRELPICPEHVALDLSDSAGGQIAQDELVEVNLQPTDERDAIVVRAKSSPQEGADP